VVKEVLLDTVMAPVTVALPAAAATTTPTTAAGVMLQPVLLLLVVVGSVDTEHLLDARSTLYCTEVALMLLVVDTMMTTTTEG